MIYPTTKKKYKCTQCGHVTEQDTNHYGQTYSLGRYNACPKCPPFRKYAEYGGGTTWECMEKPPAQESDKGTVLDLQA